MIFVNGVLSMYCCNRKSVTGELSINCDYMISVTGVLLMYFMVMFWKMKALG